MIRKEDFKLEERENNNGEDFIRGIVKASLDGELNESDVLTIITTTENRNNIGVYIDGAENIDAPLLINMFVDVIKSVMNVSEMSVADVQELGECIGKSISRSLVEE